MLDWRVEVAHATAWRASKHGDCRETGEVAHARPRGSGALGASATGRERAAGALDLRLGAPFGRPEWWAGQG